MVDEELVSEFDWLTEILYSGRILRDEAGQLEQRIKEAPNDKKSRATLLGYYSTKSRISKVDKGRLTKHILWILENAPDCGIGKTPWLHISKSDNPKDYQKAKELLLRQCERFKSDSEVLMDLACALSFEEPEIAADLLRKLHTSLSEKEDVAFWLSTILKRLSHRNNDRQALFESMTLMQEVVAAEKPDDMFDRRDRLVKLAFECEEFGLATTICNDMLSDNGGNNQSVHTAHIVLGRIDAMRNNIPAAVEHLRNAGKVGTGCRLASYGPLMQLAQELLANGEGEAVIQYLTDCKTFWELGKRKLPKWISETKRGATPVLEGDEW